MNHGLKPDRIFRKESTGVKLVVMIRQITHVGPFSKKDQNVSGSRNVLVSAM